MRWLFALIAAVLLVTGAPTVARAQEASPVAMEGMPEGMSLEILAQTVVESLPPGPTEIGFVRVTFAPGTRLPLEPEPGLAFVAVESGTLTASLTTAVQVTRVEVAGTPVAAEVTTAGVAFSLGPGESAVFPPLAAGEVGNEGAEPVVVLVVFIGPPTDEMATPAAGATPMAEEEMLAGLTFEPLAFGVVEQMPAGPTGIAIARVSLAPGVTIPQEPQVGAEVGIVEAGSFTFRTTEGPAVQVVRGVAQLATPGAEPTIEATGPGQEVTVSAGDAFSIPIGSVTGGDVVGDTDAVALIAVVEPLAAPAATPVP